MAKLTAVQIRQLASLFRRHPWIGLLIIVAIAAISWFTANPTVSPKTTSPSTPSLATSASPGASPSATASLPADVSRPYQVVDVVDGDTLDVNIDGHKTRLRLIGIDTPEVVDPRKPVQCFGKQASDFAKSILTNQQVRLESDPTQGDKDKYGRSLRYVFLTDGRFYNLIAIQQGYAHEYTYDIPYKYQTEFKQAETEARNNDRGLWSPSTCNGNTTQPAS